jgi:hypothetical protein
LAMLSAVSPPRSSSTLLPPAPRSRWAADNVGRFGRRARPRYPLGSHRTYTHSVGAVASLWRWQRGWFCAGALVRRRCCGAGRGVRVASGAGLDQQGHIVPIGLTALWPLTSRYYKSGLDLFGEISRRYWLPERIHHRKCESGDVGVHAAGAVPVSCLGFLE